MKAGFGHRILRLPRELVVLGLRCYRAVVSPLYGPTCRFYPSCSEYALIAVERYGVFHGGWLAGRRLLRCHPWNPGGVDPVPPLKAPSSGGCAQSGDSPELDGLCAGSAASDEGSTPSADTNSAPSLFRRVA